MRYVLKVELEFEREPSATDIEDGRKMLVGEFRDLCTSDGIAGRVIGVEFMKVPSNESNTPKEGNGR